MERRITITTPQQEIIAAKVEQQLADLHKRPDYDPETEGLFLDKQDHIPFLKNTLALAENLITATPEERKATLQDGVKKLFEEGDLKEHEPLQALNTNLYKEAIERWVTAQFTTDPEKGKQILLILTKEVLPQAAREIDERLIDKSLSLNEKYLPFLKKTLALAEDLITATPEEREATLQDGVKELFKEGDLKEHEPLQALNTKLYKKAIERWVTAQFTTDPEKGKQILSILTKKVLPQAAREIGGRWTRHMRDTFLKGIIKQRDGSYGFVKDLVNLAEVKSADGKLLRGEAKPWKHAHMIWQEMHKMEPTAPDFKQFVTHNDVLRATTQVNGDIVSNIANIAGQALPADQPIQYYLDGTGVLSTESGADRKPVEITDFKTLSGLMREGHTFKIVSVKQAPQSPTQTESLKARDTLRKRFAGLVEDLKEMRNWRLQNPGRQKALAAGMGLAALGVSLFTPLVQSAHADFSPVGPDGQPVPPDGPGYQPPSEGKDAKATPVKPTLKPTKPSAPPTETPRPSKPSVTPKVEVTSTVSAQPEPTIPNPSKTPPPPGSPTIAPVSPTPEPTVASSVTPTVNPYDWEPWCDNTELAGRWLRQECVVKLVDESTGVSYYCVGVETPPQSFWPRNMPSRFIPICAERGNNIAWAKPWAIPSPTPEHTPTLPPTPTAEVSPTPPQGTPTEQVTPPPPPSTPTEQASPSPSPTPEGTPTEWATMTPVSTYTLTRTMTPTGEASITITPTVTPTETATYTITSTQTPTSERTYTVTPIVPSTETATATPTKIPPITVTSTTTPTSERTYTITPTSMHGTPTETSIWTVTPTRTPEGSITYTVTPTPSQTKENKIPPPTVTITITATPPGEITYTVTPTPKIDTPTPPSYGPTPNVLPPSGGDGGAQARPDRLSKTGEAVILSPEQEKDLIVQLVNLDKMAREGSIPIDRAKNLQGILENEAANQDAKQQSEPAVPFSGRLAPIADAPSTNVKKVLSRFFSKFKKTEQ